MDTFRITKRWHELLSTDTAYLASFGPTYINAQNPAKLLDGILNYENDRKPLICDKDRRWFTEKNEWILKEATLFLDDSILLLVRSGSPAATFRFYFYSYSPLTDDHVGYIKSHCRTLKINPSAKTRITSFLKPETKAEYTTHSLFLKILNPHDPFLRNRARDIRSGLLALFPEDVRKSFIKLFPASPHGGTHPLLRRFSAVELEARIFVAVQDKSILGYYGPLELMNDFWGVTFLAPGYFETTGESHASDLIEALIAQALLWGCENGAVYSLIQEPANSSKAQLLLRLGFSAIQNKYTIGI